MYNSPDLSGDPCLRETKTWTLEMFSIPDCKHQLSSDKNLAYLCLFTVYVYRFNIYGVRLPSCTGIILSHYKDSYEPTSILECHKGFVCFVWTHLLNSEFFVKSHHQRNVDFSYISKWSILPGRRDSQKDSHTKIMLQERWKICGLMENIFHQNLSWSDQSVHLITHPRFLQAL